MPLWWDDLMTDHLVEVMDNREFGAYLRLLSKAWKAESPGTLPNEDRLLARWACETEDAWAVIKPRVLAPFKISGGMLRQKRMQLVYERLRTDSKRKSEVGKKAARKRWGECERNANAYADAMPTHSNGNTDAMPSKAKDKEDNTVPPKRVREPCKIPNLEEVKAYAKGSQCPMPEEFASWFWDYWQASGWVIGGHTSVADWQAMFRKQAVEWRSKQTPRAPMPKPPSRPVDGQDKHDQGF